MSDNPILTGLLVGQVAADTLRIGEQERALVEASGAKSALRREMTDQVNRMAADSIGIAAQVITLHQQIQTLQNQLGETRRALVAEQAHAKGLDAMVRAYSAQHPDSPLRRDSGQRYKDGDVKTAAALIFEQAHDAHIAKYGAQVGIADPTEVRAD